MRVLPSIKSLEVVTVLLGERIKALGPSGLCGRPTIAIQVAIRSSRTVRRGEVARSSVSVSISSNRALLLRNALASLRSVGGVTERLALFNLLVEAGQGILR